MKRVERAEFMEIVRQTVTSPEAARCSEPGCLGYLMLLGKEGSWRLACMRCGEVEAEEIPPEAWAASVPSRFGRNFLK